MKLSVVRLFIIITLLPAASGFAVPFAENPRLLSSRYGLAAAAVGDDIFIFGGTDGEQCRADIERFNTITGKITRMKTTLIPRMFHTAETADGKIYITGGYDDENRLRTTLEIYDPKTDAVATGAQLPTGRYLLSSVMVNNEMYVSGGSFLVLEKPLSGAAELYGRGRMISGALEIYSVANDSWRTAAAMNRPRQTEIIEMDGAIYALGGFNGSNSLNYLDAYDLKTDSWRKLKNIPFRISAHHGIPVGSKLWLFGDFHNPGRVSVFDCTAGVWNQAHNVKAEFDGKAEAEPGYAGTDPVFKPARHAAVVRVGDYVYVLGGADTRDVPVPHSIQYFHITRLPSLLVK